MKIKRISIVIYVACLLLSIFLYFLIKDNNYQNIIVGMLTAAFVPLLIEIPNVINYKKNTVKRLYNILQEQYYNCLYLKSCIQEDIDYDRQTYKDQYKNSTEKLEKLLSELNELDDEVFFSKNRKVLYKQFKNMLPNFKNTIIIANLKFEVIKSNINFQRTNAGINQPPNSRELTYELSNIQEACDNYLNLHNKYVKDLFSKKIINDWYNNEQLVNNVLLQNKSTKNK